MLRLDMTMFLTAPFAQAISGLLPVAALLRQGMVVFPVCAAMLAAAYVGGVALATILCFLSGYPLKEMGRTIFLFPVFMASWLPLQILSLFKDTKKWHPIPHSGEKTAAGIHI